MVLVALFLYLLVEFLCKSSLFYFSSNQMKTESREVEVSCCGSSLSTSGAEDTRYSDRFDIVIYRFATVEVA